MDTINLGGLATNIFKDRRSTPSLIAEAIRLAIMRGHLIPGQALDQGELARQFGMSRVPVREALRQLEADGLIVFLPHRGATVAVLSPDDIEEVFLIRESLESIALRLSIPKMTEKDFREVEKIQDQINKNRDPECTVELNCAFHERLYRPCGLVRLLNMIRSLTSNSLCFDGPSVFTEDMKKLCGHQHAQILETCRDRDEDAAVAALVQHLKYFCKITITRILSAKPTQQSPDPVKPPASN